MNKRTSIQSSCSDTNPFACVACEIEIIRVHFLFSIASESIRNKKQTQYAHASSLFTWVARAHNGEFVCANRCGLLIVWCGDALLIESRRRPTEIFANKTTLRNLSTACTLAPSLWLSFWRRRATSYPRGACRNQSKSRRAHTLPKSEPVNTSQRALAGGSLSKSVVLRDGAGELSRVWWLILFVCFSIPKWYTRDRFQQSLLLLSAVNVGPEGSLRTQC